MPYSRPTLQQIIDRIISDFNVRVDNSITFLRRSVFRILGRVFGGASHLLYEYINYVKDQLFISTADEENLERHGAEYGIFKNYGEKATGSATASGTVGITIDQGTELQSSTNNVYITDSDYTIAVGGTVTISFTAKEVGTDYVESGGVSLTFVSPITGINTNVTVTSDGITGGVDADTKDQFRTTILNRKRYPPHGGAEGDYAQWAYEYSGSVTRAWEIEYYQGVGTVGLAYVKDNDEDSIFPTETELASAKSWIESHVEEATGKTVGVPVTAKAGFFMIQLTPYQINFVIQLYPNTAEVQANVLDRLDDLFLQRAGPGQTISLSQQYEAITSASGEESCRIVSPGGDIANPTTQLAILGDVTFQNYS